MYKEILPSKHLQQFIECYWIRTSDSSKGIRSFSVVPDGCIDFVFDFEAPTVGSFVGTMTVPLEVTTSSFVNFLGVRFLPGKARSFIRFQASDVTDRIVPITDVAGLKGGMLTEKLRENQNDRIQILNLELEKWIQNENEASNRVNFAVNTILKSRGSVRIEKICESLGISRQYLSRIFRESIGIGPKQFSRIVRFQSLLQKMQQGITMNWADEALTLGYFDQAHLISDFREFSGITPAKYLCNSV